MMTYGERTEVGKRSWILEYGCEIECPEGLEKHVLGNVRVL